MSFKKITESNSPYRHLEKMTVKELLVNINTEDQKVSLVISEAIPQIEALVQAIVDKMLAGGRLFYIGAGTSGRLGIVDASECVPTYGVPPGLVIGIIAGGAAAITQPVEFAEDNAEQGWLDLLEHDIKDPDIVIGLSASGTAPYVLGALKNCREKGILTGSISCNPMAPMSQIADFPVELVTGSEFITGSTRMKAGTAQKMTLNMISTSVMIRLGRVEDNKMVNMQLTNEKLVDRGVKMVMERLGTHDYATAKQLLLQFGSVKKALENI
ncbi:MAG: N-acetylmuramic acid 6-phosphate etherase [Ferruginibacter sp.]